MANPIDKAVKVLLKRRHPSYENNVDHWDFLLACYRGERTWFDEHIHPYYKEGTENFANRIKRAYRFNHSREVVDLVNKYLFRGDIVRVEEQAPDCLKEFWKNVNGKGTPIDLFVRDIATYTSVVGRTWTVVDSNATEATVSKADEKAQGVRVYAYPVLIKDVLDMSYDRNNNLNWILIREIARDDADPFDGEEHNQYYRYRLWTKNEWILYDVKDVNGKRLSLSTPITLDSAVSEADRGEHNLGMVPVTYCDHMESDELYITPAMISDIAYLDRAVANYLSDLDVIIQDQTFSQLAMPAQNVLPGEDGVEQMKEAGTKSIFLFDGESQQPPFYLSPDADQAMVIMDVISKIINEIYHTIGMAGERTKQDNAVGIDNSSGVAKAYDFERVNAMLVSKASSLDSYEKRLSRIVCAYHNDELAEENGVEDLIKYPEDFDIRGLADEFDIAANLMLLQMPKEVRQEQAFALKDKLFPRASKETSNKLIEAIKKWPEDPIKVAQEMALDQSGPKSNEGDVSGLTKMPTKSDDNGIQRPSRQGQVTE